MHTSFITTFFLATVASVSALSLADLDPIPDNTVTPGCLAAYETEIPECPDASDFRAKKACSSECEAALTAFGQDTILVCRQAFVSTDSLLRRLLDGGLATTLCPAVSSSSSSSSSKSATATVSTSTSATSAYASASTSTSAPAPASTSTSASGTTKYASSTSATTTDEESATSTVIPTPSSVSFSGFLTITTSAAATEAVPTGLAIDESAEPTFSGGYSALAVEETSTPSSTSVSAQSSSSASSGNASPFDSGSTTTITSDQNAAGSVKAVWTTIMVCASVALAATLL